MVGISNSKRFNRGYRMKEKWYIKTILLFIKPKYKIKKGEWPEFDYRVKYKKLFGKIYIIDIIRLMPAHPNCKCLIHPMGEVTE